ncbi:MAG: aspartyl/asparaginyl beta-hydroxylase domain-containing protein [Flavobacteriales bacterium]|nr:aspartyl/asparaginyl beta-hydroxylase domain-containing protein [Flavobacteriales bacterium]
MQNNRGWLFKFFRDSSLNYYNSKIKTPAYLDLDKYFADYTVLEENWKEIKQEIEGVISSGKTLPKFHEVDDGQEYISDNDGLSWSLLNLLLYEMWHEKNCGLCPKTTSILRGLGSVKSAYFSILAPGKHIPPHKGPYKGIIRYQLALSVPKNGECKIIVDDKDCFWEEGKSVLFDDTYTHEVINNTNEVRIALLLDIKREISGFLKYYDMFVFKLIKSLVVLNNTFSKSKLK